MSIRPNLMRGNVTATSQYITEPIYHSSVPANIRAHLRSGTRSTSPARQANAPCTSTGTLVAIRRIANLAHPACGQHGLFAAKKLAPRTHLLDYLGEVHCDARPHSDYDLALLRAGGAAVGIDAAHAGNAARFVNDYRGVCARPNALFEERWTEQGELRMAVWVGSEPVRKGEEILVSYGKMWWRARTAEASESEGTAPWDNALSQQSGS
ncbi:SET domain protein [Sparassis crispa]|uniref:SET domain protein n=1 Tax=Sparassis crispa TaxID=139825 RepID=A0A401GN04_9APHY|nr:SET domain protein [Sparassis crispa]GBE83595.1 SET domain protein [Sparassis crispa]